MALAWLLPESAGVSRGLYILYSSLSNLGKICYGLIWAPPQTDKQLRPFIDFKSGNFKLTTNEIWNDTSAEGSALVFNGCETQTSAGSNVDRWFPREPRHHAALRRDIQDPRNFLEVHCQMLMHIVVKLMINE